MRRIFALFLIIVPLLMFSQTITTDCTAFDAGRGVWDMLCSIDIPAEALEYRAIEGKLTGKIAIDVILTNLTTGRSVTDSWETHSYISKMEEINKKLSLLDNTSFLLSPGEYSIDFIIKDQNSNKQLRSSNMFTLETIEDKPFMSDLLLGISVKKDSTGSKFARNGYSIIPCPSHATTNLNPFLILYTEIYNLNIGSPYNVDYIVLNSSNDTVMKLEGVRDTVRDNSFFNIGGINTIGLKEGEYSLFVSVISDSFRLFASQLINKSSSLSNPTVVKYTLSDKQLTYYDKIEYIASPSIINQMNKLSGPGKHNFLIKFWEMRDPSPDNDKLEALDEYIKKIEYVNARFSSGLEDGYDSDRGRIYIRYGEPDEDMSMPSNKGYKPYENWIYYKDGGLQFIFIDIKGFGKYELAYASTIDEDIPVNWENYVNTDIIRFARD